MDQDKILFIGKIVSIGVLLAMAGYAFGFALEIVMYLIPGVFAVIALNYFYVMGKEKGFLVAFKDIATEALSWVSGLLFFFRK